MLLIAGSCLEDEKRNGSFLCYTKEMLFARLVVTTRMLLVFLKPLNGLTRSPP